MPSYRQKVRLITFVMIFFLMTASGAFGPDTDTGTNFIWAAIGIWLLSKVLIFLRKDYSGTLFAGEQETRSVALSPTMGHLSRTPIEGVSLKLGAYNTTLVIAQPVFYLFQRADNAGKNDNTTFSLEFLVMCVDLKKQVPHIFVDGLSQNLFNSKHQNLWSISKMFAKRDRLPELEGDFPKHFQVYAADKGSMPLTILAPDVMEKIRRSGIQFDYELYGTNLYIYREKRFETPQEVDEYIRATSDIVREIAEQVRKQRFESTSGHMQLQYFRLRLWAAFYTMLIATRIWFGLILWLAYAFVIDDIFSKNL